MENQHDIFTIIQNNELNQFILGEDKYSFKYSEDGYKLWMQLVEYYKNPSTTSAIKETIENTVVDLFDAPDTKAKVSSLTLSKKLNLVKIKNKIIKTVQDNAFVTWKEYAQRDLLITATYFQIPELEEFIAATVIQNNLISNFIQWSEKRLEYNYVGRDDLWKITILAKLYDSSPLATREIIINQLVFSAKEQPRIHNVLQTFITQNSQIHTEFCERINREWVQKYKYQF